MVGSYGPNKEPHETLVVKDQEAPDGMTGRGEFTAKWVDPRKLSQRFDHVFLNFLPTAK